MRYDPSTPHHLRITPPENPSHHPSSDASTENQANSNETNDLIALFGSDAPMRAPKPSHPRITRCEDSSAPRITCASPSPGNSVDLARKVLGLSPDKPAAIPGAWPPCSSCGRTSGFTYSDEDPTVRCLCGEPRPALLAAPACIDCRQPVAPEALFCDPCFQARKVVPLEELARRREERRKSTEARLRSTPCGSCGRIDWHVTPRGDAHCRACFPARRTS